jgi:oligoendopeptidase F
MLDLKPAVRKFLSSNIDLDDWGLLEPYFDALEKRELNSVKELELWMRDRSELESALAEELGWRYIHVSRDTGSEEATAAYKKMIGEILPKVAPLEHALNLKLTQSPYFEKLDKETYRIYLRSIKSQIELFHEENIPLNTELAELAQEYGSITGQMSVDWKGEQLTLQQAGVMLRENDRSLREEIYRKIQNERGSKSSELNDLFDRLIAKRQEVAKNAGFDNYRDFKFKDLGRFDYSVDDCTDFHASIASAIVPIVKSFDDERIEKLGVDTLRPWDNQVDPEGRSPLKVFDGSAQDLLDKAVRVFNAVDPFFADCLLTMDQMGHLDLESRKGKAPGGYNYPLYETGVPFIFMNAAGVLRDFVTLIHEGGHAVHSFVTRDFDMKEFQRTPSEVAELASMSMELISMEHWDLLFDDESETKRAKKEHLEKVLEVLPWIATIDAFQHWIYTNEHSQEERRAAWESIRARQSTGSVDWTGLEEIKAVQWQSQLHLFEVPFYYIEYGMAQLGAIAIWRRYKIDPQGALADYKAALELGYTKTIGEIYERAGIRFDFSPSYVQELADFVYQEWKKL